MEAGLPEKFYIPRSEKSWCINPFVSIECKMSRENSWIFHRSSTVVGHFEIAHAIDAISLRHGFRHFADIFHPLHYPEGDIASTFTVLHTQKGRISGRDDIFEATSKLSKFVNYRLHHLREFFDETRRDIVFYFPIIVFEGALYEADFHLGALRARPIDHIVLETRIVSSVSGQLSPMYIDVVAKRRLTRFLSSIESEVASISSILGRAKTQAILNRALRGTAFRGRGFHSRMR